MMRREYTCTVSATRYGIVVPVIVRIDGDPQPGAALDVQVRSIPDGGWIPQSWADWSKPKAITLDSRLGTEYRISNKVVEAHAVIHLAADLNTITGTGEARAMMGVLASNLEIRGIKTLAEPITPPVVVDPPQPKPDDTQPIEVVHEPIAWDYIKWMRSDYSGYKLKSTMRAAINGGKITFKLDNPLGGSDVLAVGVVVRDGQPAGGSFDGMGANKGDRTSFLKGLGNMGYKNPKGGPYWCGSNAAARRKYMPAKGETVYFCVVETTTKVRTNVVGCKWP